MIRIESGYYYIQQSQTPKQEQQPKKSQQPSKQQQKTKPYSLQITTDIKSYLQHVRKQITHIKQLKKKQKQQQMSNKLILDQLSDQFNPNQKQSSIKLEIAVPLQIYQLDKRVSQLEDKITNNEIVRQKIQRKGNLSQRAKNLSAKIEQLKDKPINFIIENINSYCKNLDEKQQQNKTLFLYDTLTKTQTLTQQIQMLNVYLNNLNDLQIRLKALPPQKIIVDCHEKLLAKRKDNQQRINKLYQFMVQQYQKLINEIDSI